MIQNVIVCLLSQTDIDLHFHLILLLFYEIFCKPREGRSNKSLFEHSRRKNTRLSFGVAFFLINSINHVCKLLCCWGSSFEIVFWMNKIHPFHRNIIISEYDHALVWILPTLLAFSQSIKNQEHILIFQKKNILRHDKKENVISLILTQRLSQITKDLTITNICYC